jgi:DNA polymerase III epsilon subunit-like protein
VTQKFICVVDLETSGLDPEFDEILELAFVRMSFTPGPDWKRTLAEVDRVVGRTFPTLKVDPKAAAINGYTKEAWAETARPLRVMLEKALPLLEGAYWVGSKPQFDIGFIECACREHFLVIPKLAGHHEIDLVAAYAALWFEGKVEKVGQHHVMKHLLPGSIQTHTAEGDVDHLIELLRML